MIQCNRCNLQYIGETKRRLKDRFNERRRTIDIVCGIESASYGVICTSCLCQKPERATYERVRSFDTNNECI